MSPRASKMFLAQCWAFNTKLKVVPGQKKKKNKRNKNIDNRFLPKGNHTTEFLERL